MPCGSNHNCNDCNGYYFGCTWIGKMNTDERIEFDSKITKIWKQEKLKTLTNKD